MYRMRFPEMLPPRLNRDHPQGQRERALYVEPGANKNSKTFVRDGIWCSLWWLALQRSWS